MSGDLTPDATGTYKRGPRINGEPSYSRLDNAWHVYYDDDDGWHYITTTLGVPPAPHAPGWTYIGKPLPDPAVFSPNLDAIGDATWTIL